MLSKGWQNAIRFKNKMGDTKGAKKDLLKIRLKYYNKIDTIDKLFVSYCLALLIYQEGQNDIANKYLDEANKLLDEEGKENYLVEYHNCLWLKVNINQETMSKSDMVYYMEKVYKFYSQKGNYVIALSAISNIYEIQREGKKLLEKFENLLSLPQTIDNKTLNEFLYSLEKIDKDLYIKGVNLISIYGYKRKVN